ncbi:MAG: hypothetical protein ACOCY0_02665 [Roseicyclus sp.]
MHIRSFLLGGSAAALAAAVAAAATGLSWTAVLGLAICVWVAAQILYLGLVAHLAWKEERRSADPEGRTGEDAPGERMRGDRSTGVRGGNRVRDP